MTKREFNGCTIIVALLALAILLVVILSKSDFAAPAQIQKNNIAPRAPESINVDSALKANGFDPNFGQRVAKPKKTINELYPCGRYNGHKLYRGGRGGYYYLGDNSNKIYVDRSACLRQ